MSVFQAISCQGKVRHRSAEAAYKHIRDQQKGGRIRETSNLKLRAYRCHFCSKWHVGKARFAP